MNDHTPEAGAPLIRLGALDVEAYLGDPDRKQQFVTPMFDVIAPRYDAFTRLFSFGMDARWKREALAAAIAAAKLRAPLRALDLACGTGDFAVALAVALPSVRVTGVDASPKMIQQAEQRLRSAALPSASRRSASALPASHRSASLTTDVIDRISVQVGDMMALDATDASVDLVTVGYGVRNVPDAAVAVREIARVMRPGGTLVTLDFYRPEFSLWRVLLLGYLTVAGNLVGFLWHRDPVVYGYISRSIDHFLSWQAFSALLEREGFVVDRVVRHLGGGIALHVATRR